jgi:hypothetical protein
MANPTTNYGFVLPTSTDLVTDLPADFDVALQGVDTRLKALQPGTTLGDLAYSSATANTNTRLGIGSNGQILSVVAGVPAWVANDVGDITGVTAGIGISGGGTSGDVTVTNSMATAIDAKGDLIAGTAADTFSRIAVGANDTVLTADSSTATGLKWATPASGGMTLLSTTTLTGSSVTVSSISGSYTNLFILFNALWPTTNGSRFRFRLNGSTSSVDYNYQPSGDNFFAFPVSTPSNGTNGKLGSAALLINNYANTTTWKQYALQQTSTQQADDNNWIGASKDTEAWTNTSAINSITILTSSGNINGTMLIYGVK